MKKILYLTLFFIVGSIQATTDQIAEGIEYSDLDKIRKVLSYLPGLPMNIKQKYSNQAKKIVDISLERLNNKHIHHADDDTNDALRAIFGAGGIMVSLMLLPEAMRYSENLEPVLACAPQEARELHTNYKKLSISLCGCLGLFSAWQAYKGITRQGLMAKYQKATAIKDCIDRIEEYKL